ncbi:hypothetical protein B0H11DRAFT_1938620 [Mycena galericulata]|nr:hypothetical protein B0H11DRAFT_1938620 [Mycena galericulata]
MLSYVFMPHNFIFLAFYLLLGKRRISAPDSKNRSPYIHISRIQSSVQWRSEVEYDREAQTSDSQPVLAASENDGETSLSPSLDANPGVEKDQYEASSNNVLMTY